MHRFIVFLRGINVGGHVVVKEKLKETFISLGFQNVSTYKQSGNIVFEGDSSDPKEVADKIENKLHTILGYEVVVFVRTFPQLKNIIELDPFKGQISGGSSFLVTLLPTALHQFPLQLPLTIPKSTAQIILSKDTEVFSVTHGGGEGALPNLFLESKLKMKATTRNLNTIRKIVEKYT
jgi:uncharacterized protein (DUF1697 family)